MYRHLKSGFNVELIILANKNIKKIFFYLEECKLIFTLSQGQIYIEVKKINYTSKYLKK